MNASEIIEEVETSLLDPSGQFWTPEELLSYINDAQRQIVNFKPEANAKVENVALEAGVRQSLPDLASQLIDVTRNTDGMAITAVDQRDLDRMMPAWPKAEASTEIEHYMYDDRSPATFDVYPPAREGTQVEVIYSATLANLTNTNAELSLGLQYRSAIIEYVLYRAHSKDTQAAVPQRAQAHYSQFQNLVTGKTQVDRMEAAGEPKQSNPRELR